jgi:hypothetical protein
MVNMASGSNPGKLFTKLILHTEIVTLQQENPSISFPELPPIGQINREPLIDMLIDIRTQNPDILCSSYLRNNEKFSTGVTQIGDVGNFKRNSQRFHPFEHPFVKCKTTQAKSTFDLTFGSMTGTNAVEELTEGEQLEVLGNELNNLQ